MRRYTQRVKSPGRGPIARKVIAQVQQHLKQKVVHLIDWQEGKRIAQELQHSTISRERLNEYDAIHGAYIYGQNQLSVIVEQLTELPMLVKLNNAYADAYDEYMPSGPPMSPLTKSYFNSWGMCDLSSEGARKETLCSIASDFCAFMGADTELITIFEELQASRMGIYIHLGHSREHVFLKEIITDTEIKAVSPGGYLGHEGELWFCRVLPPPFGGEHYDYSVVFTTPYVLGKNGASSQYLTDVEADWLAYFERNLSKTRISGNQSAYECLMKYGLSKNYWNEYIFLAYRNHRHEVIMLEGVPDIPSTLPHSKESDVQF